MARSYWLSTWLREFSETTGRLRDVERDALLEETGGVERWAAREDPARDWRFERNGASEAWRILDALSHSSLAVEGGTQWLHSFDFKDSDAWGKLGPMVGVPDAELLSELPGLGEVARSRGTTVEVDDFVDLCNLRARNGMKLHSVNTHGDDCLYVALSPAACAAAVERGLLVLGPVFARTPLVGAPPVMSAAPDAIARAPRPWFALAWLMAVGAVVFAVVALARSGSPIGAIAVVVALVVGFELSKSALVRRLDAAFGARYPGVMRALKALTRT